MNEKLMDDALQVCLEVSKRRMVVIDLLLEGTHVEGLNPISTITYKQTDTLIYLESLGILKLHDITHPGAPLTITPENPLPKGFYRSVFYLDKVEQFIKKEKTRKFQLLQASNSTVTNDYQYKNGELTIKQRDGSPCTLDLSKAPLLRQVFETFYYLYIAGKTNLFTQEELLKKYETLTGKTISWEVFIKRKSSIPGKMIYPKPCLKSRINWDYDRKAKKHRFEILPLSDALSDDRIEI